MARPLIGILKVGAAPPGLAAAQGDYDARFRLLLGEDRFRFETWDVLAGEDVPGPAAADGWLITGSAHGAYEEHPWIAPLEDFIRAADRERHPLVGVCFGHQIIAQALGGRVERAGTGWITGPQPYRGAGGFAFAANAWHRDQVVEPPSHARVLARGPACPFAALGHGRHILSLQPHPEFSQTHFLGLLDAKGHVLPPAIARAAEMRVRTDPDPAPLQDAMRGVLADGRLTATRHEPATGVLHDAEGQ